MKCQVLIDWLTFSVKSTTDPVEVIQKYLGMDPAIFQDPGFGMLGYQSVLRFSDICVCYESRENEFFRDMGVCVSMSGNGCRAFETMSKLTFEGAKDKRDTESVAFPVLFQLLASDDTANISRIDVAYDDREGYLCMGDIVRKVENNEINSRMKKRAFNVYYGMNTCFWIWPGASRIWIPPTSSPSRRTSPHTPALGMVRTSPP